MNHATPYNITTCDLWFSWWSTVRMHHLRHVLQTKLCTIMMYNPAHHGTKQVSYYQIFWIIRQYLYWTKSLQAIFYCCLHRSCTTLSSYFQTIIKKLSFLNYHRPSHRISFRMHCCKPLIQHLVQLCKFWLFQSLLLDKAFHTFTYSHERS